MKFLFGVPHVIKIPKYNLDFHLILLVVVVVKDLNLPLKDF